MPAARRQPTNDVIKHGIKDCNTLLEEAAYQILLGPCGIGAIYCLYVASGSCDCATGRISVQDVSSPSRMSARHMGVKRYFIIQRHYFDWLWCYLGNQYNPQHATATTSSSATGIIIRDPMTPARTPARPRRPACSSTCSATTGAARASGRPRPRPSLQQSNQAAGPPHAPPWTSLARICHTQLRLPGHFLRCRSTHPVTASSAAEASPLNTGKMPTTVLPSPMDPAKVGWSLASRASQLVGARG